MDIPATGDQMVRVLKWRSGAVRWIKQELSNPLSLKVIAIPGLTSLLDSRSLLITFL